MPIAAHVISGALGALGRRGRRGRGRFNSGVYMSASSAS